jgi:tape measure domain-containing protein
MGLFSLVGKIKIEGAEQAKRSLDSLRESANSAAGAISSRLGTAVKNTGAHLADAAGKSALLSTALTGALGVAAFQSAAKMDSLVRALAGVSTNAQDLQAQLARLKEVAKLPGLGFEEAVAGSVALQSAGYSANLAERSLMAFGNALASAGKGKAELDGISLALQQIASKGKISAEEINQLRERAPQVGAAMQKAFGTGDTEAIGKSGIGAVKFVSKLVAELEKLPRVSGGIQNSIENLQDGIQAALRPLGQGIAEFFGSFGSQSESLLTKLEKIGQSIGEAFSAIGRSGVFQEIVRGLGGGLSGVDEIIIKVAGNLAALSQNLPTLFKDMGGYLSSLGSVIGENMQTAFNYALDKIKASFMNVFSEIKALALDTIGAILLSIPKLPGIETGSSKAGNSMIAEAARIRAGAQSVADPLFKGLPDFGQFSPFRGAEGIIAKINAARRPMSMIPEGLTYGGGGNGLEGGGGGGVFAQWDNHLAEIEKNTKSTADALDPRKVFGGGDLAKIGVTETERSRMSPDPYTRSIDNTLQSAIRRAVRADRNQTSRAAVPLYAR